MVALNLIWPFTFNLHNSTLILVIVVLSIGIEAAVIFWLTKNNLRQAVKISAIANLVSGLLGVFLIPIITFNQVKKVFGTQEILEASIVKAWLIVFVITFLLSILIELGVSRFYSNTKGAKMILALCVGNTITYTVAWLLKITEIQAYNDFIQNL
jgi:hypothetical protein